MSSETAPLVSKTADVETSKSFETLAGEFINHIKTENWKEIFNFLAQYRDPRYYDYTNKCSDTALSWAITREMTYVCLELIDRMTQIDQVSTTKKHNLYHALTVSTPNFKLLEKIIKSDKFNFNTMCKIKSETKLPVSDHLVSPLILLCGKYHYLDVNEDLALYMIESNQNVDLLCVDENGNNALHLACQNHRLKTLKALYDIPGQHHEQINTAGLKPHDYLIKAELYELVCQVTQKKYSMAHKLQQSLPFCDAKAFYTWYMSQTEDQIYRKLAELRDVCEDILPLDGWVK